jgi:uncharacterized membrane protein
MATLEVAIFLDIIGPLKISSRPPGLEGFEKRSGPSLVTKGINSMEIFPLLLVITSALIHAFWNMLVKKGLDPLSFLWWALTLSLVIFSFFFFLLGYQSVSFPSRGFIFIFFSALLHAIYFTSLGLIYDRGDLSLVYPIARSAPIFVLIWAIWFLGESPSLSGILGILIVVFGAYVIGFPTFSVNLFIRPITLLKDRSYQLAWLTALITSFYSVNDKVGVHYVPPFVYLFFANILMCFIVTPIVVMRKRGIFFREWAKNKTLIMLGSIMIPASYLLTLYAMRISRVSYIVAVRHVSVVFAVLLGSLILKEKHGKVRFLASLCIFAGVLLIGYLG